MTKSHSRLYRPGVGAIILNKLGDVFVGKRAGESSEAWQLPQGGGDENDDGRGALFRGLLEEVGTTNFQVLHESSKWYKYEIPAEIARRLWGGQYVGQRQKWYLLQFLGHDREINISTDLPEFIDWKWVDFLELEPMIIHFKRNLYKKLRGEFYPLIQQLFPHKGLPQ